MTAILHPEKFLEHLASLNLPDHTLIAVSGGRDSMVLAALCAQASSRLQKRFVALSVDHRLRAQSGGEAEQVAHWCRGLGLAHEGVVWERAEEITTGIQAAAREARYRLLIEAAYRLGCDAILTAHTQTDLAETVLMRLARGSGPLGLAAIREERPVALGAGERVRLIRPLLSISRDGVTDFARDNNIPFIDDPGNSDPFYERIRYRDLLAGLAQSTLLSSVALERTARRCAREEACQRQARRQQFAAARGVCFGWGAISFDRDKIISGDHGAMLARAIYAVGGAPYPPDEEAARAAIDNALATGAATLAGVMVLAEPSKVTLIREPAALLGRGEASMAQLRVTAGTKGLWDRRFIITNETACATFHIYPKPGEMAPPALFEGPARAVESLAVIATQTPAGSCAPVFALPGRLPEGCTMTSLIWERFDTNVIRYH